jgi:cytochrome c-type biogenesis protein CcmH
MTGFFIGAAVLLAAGLAALLWPLLRGSREAAEKRAADIVALFRDQLRELEAERLAGNVEEAQYQQSRRDIERHLLDEVAGAKLPPPGPQRARWSAVLVGVFVLIAPIGLYVALGHPDALLPGAETVGEAQAAAGKGAARPLTSAQVQKMITGLAENLQKSPGDVEGWAMLGRAYAYERQFSDAVRAYTKAVALRPKDARLLADLADAMAMANGQRLDGEPMKLIDRALQIDPKEIKALALAGTGAFEHQEYAKAAGYWERAIAADTSGELSKSLRSSLDEARALAGGAKGGPSPAADGAPAATAVAAAPAPAASTTASATGAGVRGKVSLSASLAAKAQPGDTVFVFARAAQGPRVPLALMRRQVKDLPFDFALDDSMAMMPDFTMSKYAPVIVGARISHSGDAIPAAGDLQGFSKPVAVGTSAVNVVIDEVVQ